MLKKKGDCKLEVDTWDLNIFCINNICSFPPLVQDDIIRSLQSRLDIICDEADEDPGPIGEDDREAIQPSEKPVSRLILCLLRFVKCSFCGVFGVSIRFVEQVIVFYNQHLISYIVRSSFVIACSFMQLFIWLRLLFQTTGSSSLWQEKKHQRV